MFGQLGFGEGADNIIIDRPRLHPYFADNLVFTNIKCGALFSMFITITGQCFLCGDNDEGQIGNNIRKTDVKVPYLVNKNIAKDVKIVDGDCGNKHSVMITEENKIWCVGDNTYKQCIPYSESTCFESPVELLKADIGIEDYHCIERVITGVDATVFIICP